MVLLLGVSTHHFLACALPLRPHLLGVPRKVHPLSAAILLLLILVVVIRDAWPGPGDLSAAEGNGEDELAASSPLVPAVRLLLAHRYIVVCIIILILGLKDVMNPL